MQRLKCKVALVEFCRFHSTEVCIDLSLPSGSEGTARLVGGSVEELLRVS